MIPYSRIASGGVTFTVNSPGRASRISPPAGGSAEERRDPLPRVHLAHEDALPRAGGEDGEGGRNGRLPHAPLARHHDEPPIEQGRGGHEA